jgi:hypothetical protein
VDVEGCGKLSVHDDTLDVSWFCFVQDEKFIGWRSASALGDRRVCGSFLVRVTSMHTIKSIRMFEDDVT